MPPTLSDLFQQHVANSSLLISACLASLTFFTQIVLFHKPHGGSLPLNWTPFWLVFFEALLIYTTDRVRDAKKTTTKKYSLGWIKLLQKVGAIGLMGTLVGGQSWNAVVLVVAHLSLGVIYALPWRRSAPRTRTSSLPEPVFSRQTFRLKDIPYFKSFFVAFTVAFMVVLAPLVYYRDPTAGSRNEISFSKGCDLAWSQPTLLLQVIVTILLMVLFVENLQDIRDLLEDYQNGTKTLPVGFGVRRTKEFLLVLGPAMFMTMLVVDYTSDNHGFHACCMLSPGTLLITMSASLGRRSPAHLFSYLETIYLAPIATHLVVTVWLKLDPFLRPPVAGEPLPWHFPYVMAVAGWIGYINLTYFLSNRDCRDDLLTRNPQHGSAVVKVTSIAMVVASGVAISLMTPAPGFGDYSYDNALKLAGCVPQALLVVSGIVMLHKMTAVHSDKEHQQKPNRRASL